MQLKSFFRIGILILSTTILIACKKDETPKDNTITDPDDSHNYTVSTFAGNGSPALLYTPVGMAFDSQGNLIVADSGNDRIRKINSAGVMTTLAGSTIGYADGPASTAQFSRPDRLGLDAPGNVYVIESRNPRIRKITPAGVVTTLAGNGVGGLVDGTGIAAQIDAPLGIAVDPQGNIYFTQSNFHGIRKATPSGEVSTFVGSSTAGYAEGIGSAARFNEPFGLTIDAQGNIYAVDSKNIRIRKITPAGVVTTAIQRANDTELFHVAIDAQGNFYTSQTDINRTKVEIVKISPTGSITKIAGGLVGYADGPANTAKFSYLTGMALNANGDLYVAELFNNTIRKIKRN